MQILRGLQLNNIILLLCLFLCLWRMCFVCVWKRVSVDVTASAPHIPRRLEGGGGGCEGLYLFANEETVL